jgi:hypothetical protein
MTDAGETMRTKMTNRAFRGVANVLPENVATWEAAGWVVDPVNILKTSNSKKGKDQ